MAGGETIKNKNMSKLETQQVKEKEYDGIKTYGGLVLSFFGGLCAAVVVVLVKILKGYNYDAFGVAFWRYTGITLPAIPVLIFCGFWPGLSKRKAGISIFDSVWPITKNWKTWIGLLVRGLIASTCIILLYYSLHYLSVADTLVISKSTPVLVTVMAHFVLGEKCGLVPLIIVFTTLGGVLIVTRPPLFTGADAFHPDTLIGICLAIEAVFLASLSTIITRSLRHVHFALMMVIFGLIGMIETAILAMTMGHLKFPEGWHESLLFLGVGGLSFLGSLTLILALKFETAGPVVLVRTSDVVFGFVLQYLFLDVLPDIYSVVGAVIILLGGVAIGWRKYITSLPEIDGTRLTWSWFTK